MYKILKKNLTLNVVINDLHTYGMNAGEVLMGSEQAFGRNGLVFCLLTIYPFM
jgi:hypothetical protein